MDLLRFRAWDTECQMMIDSDDIIGMDFENEYITVQDIYPASDGAPERDLIDYRFDRVILMQSAGLVDKNGQDIFEGDVVRLKYTVYSDYEIFKVTRFRGGSWRIDNRQRGTELWLRHKDCEVIGNIYDNPEFGGGLMIQEHQIYEDKQTEQQAKVITSLAGLICQIKKKREQLSKQIAGTTSYGSADEREE